MKTDKILDVIVAGGSFAGLSAAMALGRANRNVLIIDNGKPCNNSAPLSYNFLTWDGAKPMDILKRAKEDVKQYPTIQFIEGTAAGAKKIENGFELVLENGERYDTKKLLFTTGVTDIMPEIKGFPECWGKSVLHCPYCHGYEESGKTTAVLGNGINAFDLCMVLIQWTRDIILLTNGLEKLTDEQQEKLRKHQIQVIEKPLSEIEHEEGKIQAVHFKDNTKLTIPVMYAKPDFRQHCDIPEKLGCKISDSGHIEVDECKKTSVYGLYAAGDNTSKGRAISLAIAAGTVAGIMLNGELTSENF